MLLYHKISVETLNDVMSKGLTYGSKGIYSQDDHIAKVNDYLDDCCPRPLRECNVSRNNCLYFYLTLGGKVHDITDGRSYGAQDWIQLQQDMLLLVELRESEAYLSDLDAYDALAKAMAARESQDHIAELAQEYWNRLIALDEVAQYYQLRPEGLVCRTLAPSGLPAYLSRVEVMATCDIPPERIRTAS